ncbi:hypothetical protein LSAT2_001651 [Lamellibrachia satsuma]|nr:hypothetical protein LSAT2_001651 [Lamellibrachia satsuma]
MAKDSEPDATDELTDDQEENMWSQLKVVKEEGSGGSSDRTSVDNPRTKASQENHREQHPHHKVEPISLGVPKQTLNMSLPSRVVLPPLKTSFRHTVLVKCLSLSLYS